MKLGGDITGSEFHTSLEGGGGGGCLVLESRDSFLSPRVLSSTPCLPFFILENESYSPPPTFNPIFKNLYPNLKKYAFFEYVIQAFGIKFKDTPGTKKVGFSSFKNYYFIKV